jgi:lipopolysaccharide/colanic/teichoic acid biosynthesis glycosyltransferase
MTMPLPCSKRVLDIALTLVALVLLSPLFLLVSAAVRVIMGPPVLFRQVRAGLAGTPFVMRKFRTMHDAWDEHGAPLRDELRLHGLGRFLRATSLDELPELWSVLVGDMSLVGPRPLLMEYLPLYSDEQRRRHEVPPGMTGWAQVNGRNAISWERKFELDVWYVDNRTFWLDLRILWMTVVRVMRSEGITQTGHASAEPFRGNLR